MYPFRGASGVSLWCTVYYFCVAFLLLSLANTSLAEKLLVRRATGIEKNHYSHQQDYKTELLELALNHSSVPFELENIPVKLGNSARAIRFIEQGKFDVGAFHTTRYLEQTLLPVRIPVFKGVVGLRLPLIRTANSADFARITTLKDLQHWVAVQGFNWPDSAVLTENGLPLQTGSDLAQMRRLVLNERADYFPRSVMEIWEEEQIYSLAGLVVEQSLVIYYQSACYFFVNKNKPELAAAIEAGLERAIADGSFDDLFNRYFGPSLEKANLPRRHMIHMANHQLPPGAPVDRKELWFMRD